MNMPKHKTPYLIGITGGSGSGKTSFISELEAFFPKDQLCILSQDNYYISREDQPIDSQGVRNFDTPTSINQEEFARDVDLLKNGKVVRRKEYTFNNPNVVAKDLEFRPAPVIVVEGIFVFYLQKVANLLDLKIFIDAEDFLNLKRRIIRDGKERGYDMDDVLYRFEKHVMPTFRKYIMPFRNDADLIIPNNENFDKGLDVLVGFIKQKIG